MHAPPYLVLYSLTRWYNNLEVGPSHVSSFKLYALPAFYRIQIYYIA
jgi:hypothetical protein